MAMTQQQDFDHDTDTDSRDTLSPEESRAMFDREARHWAGVPGEEFLRRWDAGEYRNIPDTPEGRRTMEVIFLLPFVRRIT
ncbi:MAG: hypothetical protein H0W06_07555 [Chloroflexia bacterium]|nr:hypothetical protein [Chloroflexia bacterium]